MVNGVHGQHGPLAVLLVEMAPNQDQGCATAAHHPREEQLVLALPAKASFAALRNAVS